ncbi:thioesterase domain-containing protein [Burkholderiaceae bacterium DAT-1]|nr:thioesterase domain-containing protein [Burkholderiaceae bacterium DAT-1]
MQRNWSELLHHSIPLAQAMQVGVVADEDGLHLVAPLEPNVNDKGTGFGGSLSALATLAGWCACLRILDKHDAGHGVEIVIQRSTIEYALPVTGKMIIVPRAIDGDAQARFVRMLSRKGLGRLAVVVEVRVADEVCVTFQGEYVARKV